MNTLRLLLAAALVACLAPPIAAKSVLGVEAATPVKAWFSKLDGLKIKKAAIDRSTVNMAVTKSCTMVITHPEAPACESPTASGNTAVCWEGKCPKEEILNSALTAAGPLVLPWRSSGGDGEGPDRERSGMLQIHERIQAKLAKSDTEGVKALLKPLQKRKDIRAIEWVGLLPVMAAVDSGKTAYKIAQRKDLSAMGTEKWVTLHITLLMGADMGAAVAEALMTPATACEFSAFTSAYLTVRDYEAAGTLGFAIRNRAPDCFEAYASESEAWTILRKLDKQKAASEAAIARFSGDPRLVPIEEAYYTDHGKKDLVIEKLRAAVRSGDTQAGTLKRLLGFYIEAEGRKERLAMFQEKADADPTDVLSVFFTGVILHYERDYALSTEYLKKVEGKVSDEPRLYIYLAMNAFNLGDREASESYISKAAALDQEDPDVAYCVAEIFRDSDRKRALKAVDRYWEMTKFTSDVNSEKQQRVLKMRGAIQKCLKEKTEPPCPGPWEHFFDLIRLEKQWAEQMAKDDEAVAAKAAERKRREARPESDLTIPPGMDPSKLPPGFVPPGVDPKKMPAGMDPSKLPSKGTTKGLGEMPNSQQKKPGQDPVPPPKPSK